MANPFHSGIKFSNIAFVAGLTLVLSSCSWIFYDRIQAFDDEFRDTRKVIARMDVNPIERRTEINSARIIFEREFSERNDNVKAYFVIARSTSSFGPANEGFIKIGDEAYEVSFDNLSSMEETRTETSASTFIKSDSTGVTSGSTADTDTKAWIADKFMIELTDEMAEKVKTADKMLVRFYFGPVPGTFRIRGMDLNSVKRMLSD